MHFVSKFIHVGNWRLSSTSPETTLNFHHCLVSPPFPFCFVQGVGNIAAVSLEIGYPTVASVPHSIVNGFKNVASVCLEADIDIPEIQTIKEYLADPSKFAVAAAPAAAGDADKPAEAEQKKEESEEESDDDMGFGLFD